MAYLIGEALVGKGNEIAHVDLLIGDKQGPVGTAFANGLVNLSVGHTPLLAVMKPNLPPKPHTLIVPKVTVKNLDQAGLIFGPAQSAVAKAVADALEENIIPHDKVDEWVIICSVFVHPKAKDLRKIYNYNYGAVKLALRRAMAEYPPIKKIFAEKGRAMHPIMGFRPQSLWDPPYLQVALDTGTIQSAKKVIQQLPRSDRIIIELGTPLLKKEGVENTLNEIRKVALNSFIIADLKTLDVGRAEVQIAANATADAVIVSGQAPVPTLESFIREANKQGTQAWIDTLGTTFEDISKSLSDLKEKPNGIVIHRGIDEETKQKRKWGEHSGQIKKIREICKPQKVLIAVAGGIKPGEEVTSALTAGADILIVGRYIYRSPDPYHAANRILDYFREEADTMRLFDKIDY
ncbi:MAG: bifunctional 5,6,7,8-tetrahydromethanopterin hydro-lyase/3-hexulose-6-phosphate synthase [Candidatus Hermodarchaeota archaeon]